MIYNTELQPVAVSMLPKDDGNTEGYYVLHSNPNTTTSIEYHFLHIQRYLCTLISEKTE
ncbi:MAG: hypothetical protein U0V72_01060 [Cytophagales bacterium]